MGKTAIKSSDSALSDEALRFEQQRKNEQDMKIELCMNEYKTALYANLEANRMAIEARRLVSNTYSRLQAARQELHDVEHELNEQIMERPSHVKITETVEDTEL